MCGSEASHTTPVGSGRTMAAAACRLSVGKFADRQAHFTKLNWHPMAYDIAYKYGGEHSADCVCPCCGFHSDKHSLG